MFRPKSSFFGQPLLLIGQKSLGIIRSMSCACNDDRNQEPPFKVSLHLHLSYAPPLSGQNPKATPTNTPSSGEANTWISLTRTCEKLYKTFGKSSTSDPLRKLRPLEKIFELSQQELHKIFGKSCASYRSFLGSTRSLGDSSAWDPFRHLYVMPWIYVGASLVPCHAMRGLVATATMQFAAARCVKVSNLQPRTLIIV